MIANHLQLTETSIEPEQGVLIEAELSSSFSDFVNQAVEIATRSPQIVAELDHDLDVHALQKKAVRDADRRYFEQINPSFDAMADLSTPETCSLELQRGRPRMPAIVVLVLLLVRGWLGGPKSTQFQLILKESITLRRFFDAHQINVPGASTIADNINAVREPTLKLVLRSQLNCIREEGLDSFEDFIADSTAVSANSVYPTDSNLLAALAMRMTGLFDRLKRLKLGLPDWTQRDAAKRAKEVAEEIELHAKCISLLSGKKNAATDRKALYAKIYTRVGRLIRVFKPILATASEALMKISLPPSKAHAVQDLIDRSQEDLECLDKISAYSRERVFRDKQAPASEKVVSISDDAASIIKKGGRDHVLGYRNQIGFSGRGFATAHITPEGNASDSGQLQNLLDENERNTCVVPKRVSLDDGYTNSKVRACYLAKHEGKVDVFSFAGSKGRKAIGEETYESAEYKKARSDRSAAESRIFTLKFNHGYGDVMRRGIDAVRHEQLTKALSYNVRRMVWVREEIERETRKAAQFKKAA